MKNKAPFGIVETVAIVIAVSITLWLLELYKTTQDAEFPPHIIKFKKG